MPFLIQVTKGLLTPKGEPQGQNKGKKELV